LNSIAMCWGLLKAKICAGSEEEQITKHIQKCYPLTTPRQRKKNMKKDQTPSKESLLDT